MRAEEGSKKTLLAVGIVAIVFNVVFLLVPFAHTASFWTAYLFGLVTLVACAAGNLYVIRESRTPRAGLYRTSVVEVSFVYLGVSIALNLVVAALFWWEPTWIVIVLNVFALAAYAIAFLGSNTGAELVEEDEARTSIQTGAMAGLREQAGLALEATAPDAPYAAELRGLVEDLRYADPVSNEFSQPYETQLSSAMASLASFIDAGQTDEALACCRNARAILKQRNIACRRGK